MPNYKEISEYRILFFALFFLFFLFSFDVVEAQTCQLLEVFSDKNTAKVGEIVQITVQGNSNCLNKTATLSVCDKDNKCKQLTTLTFKGSASTLFFNSAYNWRIPSNYTTKDTVVNFEAKGPSNTVRSSPVVIRPTTALKTSPTALPTAILSPTRTRTPSPSPTVQQPPSGKLFLSDAGWTVNLGQTLSPVIDLRQITKNGKSPYSYSKKSGNIPDGMSFRNGIISGTPKKVSKYIFQVEVKDNSKPQQTARAEFSIEVLPSDQGGPGPGGPGGPGGVPGGGVFPEFQLPVGLPVTLIELEGLVNRIAFFLIRIAGVVAVIAVIWSGITWMFVGSNVTRLENAKKRFRQGIIGALIIFGVGVILRTIYAIVIRVFFF